MKSRAPDRVGRKVLRARYLGPYVGSQAATSTRTMVIDATGDERPKRRRKGVHGRNVPISRSIRKVTLVDVSMYVDILSSALDEWVTDLTGPDLIEYALFCREELRAVSPPNGGSAYTALAAEIAYDRALIALCTERGIYAHATSFSYPSSERRRIEAILRRHGIDLDAPPNRRTRTEPPSQIDGSAETVDQTGTLTDEANLPPRVARDR